MLVPFISVYKLVTLCRMEDMMLTVEVGPILANWKLAGDLLDFVMVSEILMADP